MAGSGFCRIQWSRRLSLAAACLATLLVLACLASAFILPPSSAGPAEALVPAHAPSAAARPTRRPPLHFCTSAQCQQEGQRLNSSIARDQNPCHDPYRYACGHAAHSQVADLRRGDERRLSALLSSTVVPRNRQTVAEKAAALYQGCLNTESATPGGRWRNVWVCPSFHCRWTRSPPVAPEQLAGHLLRHLGLGPLINLRLAAPPGNRSAVAIYVHPPPAAASWHWNGTASALQALTQRSPDGQLVRALVELDRTVARVAVKATPPVATYVPRYHTVRIFSLPQHAKWRWREVFSALLEDLGGTPDSERGSHGARLHRGGSAAAG
ncbi:hypothetical protein MRX96_033718 [Rhipicephalus microplus]